MKRGLFSTFTVLASCAAAQAVPVPGAWWSFDSDPLDALTPGGDGRIMDQGPNGVNLEVFERGGLGGQSIANHRLARELVVPGLINSGPTRYLPSGATFAGSGEAFHVEGGIHRNYLGNNSRNENTQIAGQASTVLFTEDKFSSTTLRVNPLGNPAAVDFSSPFLNSSPTGELTYSMWINVPTPVGAIFNNLPENNFPGGSNERFHDNSFMVIGRESAPSEGGADFGGQVRFILQSPGSLPPTYAINVRGNDHGAGGIQATTTNALIPMGEWHHLVVSYGPTNTLVYLDGLLTDTLGIGTFDIGKNAIEPITGDVIFNNVAFQGATRREGGNYYIDDVGIWQQRISAADVALIHRLGIRNALTTQAAATPEPATAMFLLIGGVGLVARRRQRLE